MLCEITSTLQIYSTKLPIKTQRTKLLSETTKPFRNYRL